MSNESNTPETQKKSKRPESLKRWMRRRAWNNLRFSALSILVVTLSFLLILLFVIFFPRSTVSNIENRNLASFPKFTLSSYFSGDFTSDVATWFDDTVPFRDTLKNMGYSFKTLFGFSTEDTITFINQDVVANDMNAATADENAADEDTANDTLQESSAQETGTETVAEASEEPDQKDFTAEDAEYDLSNGLLVVKQDGHWKCLALFGGGSGSSYISALNSLQEQLGDGVTIYSMPAPLASQFYTPANAASYSADQSECFDSVASQLDSRIRSINLCSIMEKHTEENIYLRTDHHWAPLGAYYAARTFAETAGVDFADLSTYTEGVNEGYVGTMYAYSQDARILNDPEDFVYYTPSNEYHTYYYDTYFNYQNESDLILEMPTESSYLMFMGGDDKIVKITTDVDNGRKLLIIKDSYGNAEVPFYTGSFEEIYVTDMRYFNCNLVNFIQDLGITDVLFTMCSYSVVGSNAENLATMITQSADQHVTDTQVPQTEAAASDGSETSDSVQEESAAEAADTADATETTDAAGATDDEGT